MVDIFQAVCREAQYLALRKVNTEDKEGVRETPDKMSLVCIQYDDIHKALSVVRPSAMREVTIEVPKVNIVSHTVWLLLHIRIDNKN